MNDAMDAMHTAMPPGVLEGPSAWYGRDFQDRTDWIYHLSAEEIEDGQRGWVAAQSAAAPTLLPDLKFHDLVFGHDLGSGSFSTVKYARQILKQTPSAGGPSSGASRRVHGPQSDGAVARPMRRVERCPASGSTLSVQLGCVAFAAPPQVFLVPM